MCWQPCMKDHHWSDRWALGLLWPCGCFFKIAKGGWGATFPQPLRRTRPRVRTGLYGPCNSVEVGFGLPMAMNQCFCGLKMKKKKTANGRRRETIWEPVPSFPEWRHWVPSHVVDSDMLRSTTLIVCHVLTTWFICLSQRAGRVQREHPCFTEKRASSNQINIKGPTLWKIHSANVLNKNMSLACQCTHASCSTFQKVCEKHAVLELNPWWCHWGLDRRLIATSPRLVTTLPGEVLVLHSVFVSLQTCAPSNKASLWTGR